MPILVGRVVLPVEARDAKRLARRLAPEVRSGLYVLEVCRGLDCKVCAYPEPPRIVIERRRVEDPLSSLTMKLPVPRAEVCGRTVWRAEWRRGMLRVESIWCPATVEEGCVRLWDGRCLPPGDAVKALREMCGVGDAGRGHSPR